MSRFNSVHTTSGVGVPLIPARKCIAPCADRSIWCNLSITRTRTLNCCHVANFSECPRSHKTLIRPAFKSASCFFLAFMSCVIHTRPLSLHHAMISGSSTPSGRFWNWGIHSTCWMSKPNRPNALAISGLKSLSTRYRGGLNGSKTMFPLQCVFYLRVCKIECLR